MSRTLDIDLRLVSSGLAAGLRSAPIDRDYRKPSKVPGSNHLLAVEG